MPTPRASPQLIALFRVHFGRWQPSLLPAAARHRNCSGTIPQPRARRPALPARAPPGRRHSPHVVKLLGACLEDKNRLALIMELCDGGNLAQRIYSPSKRRLDTLEVRGRPRSAARRHGSNCMAGHRRVKTISARRPRVSRGPAYMLDAARLVAHTPALRCSNELTLLWCAGRHVRDLAPSRRSSKSPPTLRQAWPTSTPQSSTGTSKCVSHEGIWAGLRARP
jgi:hypothetical protein